MVMASTDKSGESNTMHVVILGATGATGRQVVQQSLARNWSVTAVVRKPDSFKEIVDDNLKVIVGDVYDTECLRGAFQGCDAVLSCLGHRGFTLPWWNVDIYSKPVRSMVHAIRETDGLNRLVLITSAGVRPSPDNSFVFDWLIKPTMRAPLADVIRTEDYLASEECRDIDFTVVKPKLLTHGPITDTKLTAEEKEWAVGRIRISRADVARFMLDCVTSEMWVKKFVSITLP
ncbi:hypothetical protein CAPTEDRAFT_222649 [Capitella teleta]|uniref:NAD(P)-binding domain-containing protein n=1 Tax=Capitella teleta TaxID=283909 RepID=R7VFK1_CAPTE|nr:hypothetical protein CAPTEDRAFT_222649 [Capitella teleta]|eukprot:ELU17347.1 hypothetical protein CAPTEDRAFT_222649 [Capitella teleta]